MGICRGSGATTSTESATTSTAMRGTPRQIAYANSIKDEVTRNMSLVIPRKVRDILTGDVFGALTDAKFWIDNVERIRMGLIRLDPDEDNRAFAVKASDTINWLLREARRIDPVIAAKYPPRRTP